MHMKNLKSLLLSTILLIPILSLAQTGFIRGTVIEDESGEPLFGVTVAIEGTGTGSITDFEGKFEIKTTPGTYNLQISYISYETINITGVVVEDGKTNILDNIRLKSAVEQLQEIVVTAEVIRSSEAALMTIKKKSSGLIDGISSAKFRQIGDSDAADAVKRVTGVSVEGGKYVYVRGLGDRYTKTMLNNVDIPGLDPDRNSLQIDIFPTNLLNNMVVYKTSVAELPADFTGGVVNIETKDFPEEKIFDISLGIGFNPEMHFNDQYLDYEGSDTDVFGFDTDTRELPSGADQENIPSPISGDSDEVVGDFLRSFSPTLASERETSMPDYSIGLSLGNQKTLENDNKIGYIFSATYKNTKRYYDQSDYGEYQISKDPDVYELLFATVQDAEESTRNILLGGLAGLAYKTKNSKYSLNVMHLQNGESRTARIAIDNNDEAIGQSGYTAVSDNLEYSERGLTNILLNGQHHLKEGTWHIDWRVSPTFSNIQDPDIRKTAYSDVAGGTQRFEAGQAGNPIRIWRYLDEINMVGKVDFTRDYTWFEKEAKLKFGLSQVLKERDYRILTYNLQFFGQQPEWTGDANEVLTDENLYPNGVLYYNTDNVNPNPNEYNSTVSNSAAYISNEFSPFSRFKATIGLRAENYVQMHTGRDQIAAARISSGIDRGLTEAQVLEELKQDEDFNGNFLQDEKVLDALDLFPSANLIYELKENMNLRASYSRTIARPSFKELSFAQIIDPVSNRIFNGGLFPYVVSRDTIINGEEVQIDDVLWDGNLSETRINNYDLRWEMFLPKGQLFSISVFYKTFDDPIELVRIPSAQTSNEFQPRNVGDGQVYGAEVEFRKHLGFISPALDKISLSTNVTVVESVIDMTEVEFQSRKNSEKSGQTIEDTRQMAGQAPYIINAGLSYSDIDRALDMGFYYNVKGETLTVVGGGIFPDVYSEPFHSLKFSLNKGLGPEQRTSLSFNVSNILNDLREEFYTGFRAEDQVFTRFNPGISFSLGLKYSVL